MCTDQFEVLTKNVPWKAFFKQSTRMLSNVWSSQHNKKSRKPTIVTLFVTHGLNIGSSGSVKFF